MSTTRHRILIVDDESASATGLAELMNAWGYEARAAASGEEALRRLEHQSAHVVISDLMMPGMSGLALMAQIRERYPLTAVILLTGHGTIENATQAMREGAHDYLTKPVDLPRLSVVLQKALEQVTAREEISRLRSDLAERGKFGSMVGRAPGMREVYRIVSQAAPSRASVLITGESGTGKEIVARTLHEMSPRRDRPFIAVNCAAIPESLLESEIFGHERGAFTGALAAREGCFELANGGTLLLDEIGEMSPELQAKLLRVLEEKKLRRVGGRNEFGVDVRVLSSTNIDIGQALRKGSFREDLFYRLNVFTIHLPPLRERLEDVPLLGQHFLEEFAAVNGRHDLYGFSAAALEALRDHTWPGNARELRNVVERAVIVGRGPWIEREDLPALAGVAVGRPEYGGAAATAGAGFGTPALSGPAAPLSALVALGVDGEHSSAHPNGHGRGGVHIEAGTTLDEAERRLILETLRLTNDNKTRAAEILGVSTKTLHNKLKRYGETREAV